MQVTISARHGSLPASTQEKVAEKAEKLRRFYDRLTSVQITVDLEHQDSPRVEIRVTAEHHSDFVATDSSSNVVAAFDSASRKLEQQLRKHKEKLTGHRSPGLKQLGADLEPEPDGD